MWHNFVLALGFGLVSSAVIALGAVGFTVQFAITNHINFAYGSYMALAAYITWDLNVHLHFNFWLAAAISTLSLGVFAVVVNRIIFQPFLRRRTPVIFMLIVTLGLWLILSNVLLLIWGPTPRQYERVATHSIHLGPFLLTADQIAIVLVAIVALGALHTLLTRTKLGKAMRAMSDDSGLAQASGINTKLVTHFTWAITGCLVGFSGSVLALVVSSFSTTFGDTYLFVIYAAVILGGIGQPYGAMLGALFIGFATELSAVVLPSQYKTDIAFGLLVVLLFVRPQGILASKGVTS
jgi:branched-chain amino acid transport system permease protein/neutral amino acid transport system permease protein